MENKSIKENFQARSPTDRRKVNDRRLLFKQEYLNHKPERRVNMTRRQTFIERRGFISDFMDGFWI